MHIRLLNLIPKVPETRQQSPCGERRVLEREMEKGFVGGDESASSRPYSSSRDVYLKHVSRNSHKISKPIRKPPPLPAAVTASSLPSSSSGVSILNPNSSQSQLQSQQPPVYNINKNDFRDVVQKLTGSPAYERSTTPAPPAAAQTKPPSSRLQRIRPPPLAQIVNFPPQNFPQNVHLPPLPAVHTAAESPISAYMRFIQSSASAAAASPLRNGGASIAPRSNSLLPQIDSHSIPPPPSNAIPPPSSANSSPLPLSPLPFGCIHSPKSPYASLFSPTGLFGLHLPLSPILPVPSPR